MRSVNAAASGVARDRMAGPGSRLGGVVQRLGRDEARALADELSGLWHGDASARDRAAAKLTGLFRELGLATREDLDEAELRIAQLEHRLRLLENGRAPAE
jgi:polyhydroxyalkanoate synthesis regulator phasin